MLDGESMSKLGESVTCEWATKQQLIITVLIPITGRNMKYFYYFGYVQLIKSYLFNNLMYFFLLLTDNPLRLTFKKGVLKQDGQRYALPKNESRVSILSICCQNSKKIFISMAKHLQKSVVFKIETLL